MTPAEALTVLRQMRENLSGQPAHRSRFERRALDVAIAHLADPRPHRPDLTDPSIAHEF